MCNAYGLTHPLTAIAQAFSEVERPLVFPAGAPNFAMREDIRPTEPAPVVRVGVAGVELVSLRWGFAAPAMSGGKAGGARRGPVYNFRSEGRRFENGAAPGQGGAARCLIPASHFFEFTDPPHPTSRAGGRRALKSKWAFTWAEGDPGGDPGQEPPPLFCIAGWMRAGAAPEDEAGDAGAAFTMLTCAPGPDVAPYHDRQVVVLGRRDWATWLDGDADEAAALLRPAPAGTLRVRQVR